MQQVDDDPKLAERWREIYETQGDRSCDALVKLAAEHGLTFTVAELHQAYDMIGRPADELTNEQLEAVSGGAVGFTMPELKADIFKNPVPPYGAAR